MNDFEPAYLKLLRSGELKQRVAKAYEHLSICDVCAWKCPVDRRAGKLGVCRTGVRAVVASYHPHFGEESVLRGQAFMYLHYADMIANGYHRTMPCPFQRQGLLLNPDGSLYYCENSAKIGNVLTTSAEELYFRAENLAHRAAIKREVCGTCLSPCQVNVGALKQFVPYAKFLVRAWRVKREARGRSQTTPADTGPTLQAAAAADTPQRAASDR